MNQRKEALAKLSVRQQALVWERIGAVLNNSELRAGMTDANGMNIGRVRRKEVIPLSYAQERLWFLDQLILGNAFYNIPVPLRVRGSLDIRALEHSFSEVVRRHEVLRTRFQMQDGKPVQVIEPELKLKVTVTDLMGLGEKEREAEVQRLVMEEAGRPFDLALGPLIRVRVLRLGELEHVLMLTMHHIVSDGWSMGVLVREVVTLYEAFRQDQESPLPELPIQYVDYAVWQRDWLKGEVLEEQLGYWREQLKGLTTLELPTDRRRPAVQTYQGATYSFVLARELSEKLNQLSRKHGITLFMIFLAAYEVLLSRYTGQEDISVGTPIANRNRTEIEGLIGFFANTLVMRTDLAGDPTFVELLARIREVALEAYAHQDLPFERLVEELRPRRDLSRNPLFQVMFAFQNVLMPEIRLPGLTFTLMQLENGTSKFDLTLFMADTAQGLVGTLEYNTDLFDESTVVRMAGHYQGLLEEIVKHPERRISELELLSERERQELDRWNETGVEYPADKCIHELFEAQVERSPEATAVVFTDQRLSYRELNQRANQLAHHLLRLGVGPEVRVGICVERSLEMVVGLLGILKAGGAYVPLDPEYPKQRLQFMLDDARVAVLLTQQTLLDHLPEHALTTVCLDRDWKEIASPQREMLQNSVYPDSLAGVFYTSGSTGEPKGVMTRHRSIVAYLSFIINVAELKPEDRILQLSSVSFDPSIIEILAPILSGATLVVPQDCRGIEPSTYSELLSIQLITAVLCITPGLLESILSLQDKSTWPHPHTRWVTIAGETLRFDLCRRARKTFPFAKLVNQCGPTECTMTSTWFEVREEGTANEALSIGRPIPNSCIFVLDPNLLLVPIGVVGELYIGGAGLARGYLGRPRQTAEKFIPHPFSTEPGARLYRTGDLGRYRADGNLEFIGRIDHQVKIRGYRIELGEVEAALGQHPGVREAVVMAREDEPGAKRLVGYVVGSDGVAPTVSELRGYLKEKLPEYMVPAAFVYLESLPLTPNGKVDRRALPVPEGGRPDLAQEYVAPRTPTEEVLAGIWAEVLRVERVGIYDNFFELGGHSLIATQAVARTTKAFNIENISVQTLFQVPTIYSFAQTLSEIFGSYELLNDIAKTIREVDELSDDQVRKMISEMELVDETVDDS
jgi:amino acid adenylation domain-containing protein